MSQAWPDHVAGLARLYRGPVSPRALARYCAPYRRLLGHVAGRCISALAALYHDPDSPPQPRYKILYRGPPLARPLAVSLPKRPPPSHDTNLYHDSPWPSHARARATACPTCRPAVSLPVSWPYHTVSWAWPGRIVAMPWLRPSQSP